MLTLCNMTLTKKTLGGWRGYSKNSIEGNYGCGRSFQCNHRITNAHRFVRVVEIQTVMIGLTQAEDTIRTGGPKNSRKTLY